MSIFGDVGDFFGDVYNLGKDAAEDAVDAAKDAAEALAAAGVDVGDIVVGATLDLIEQLQELSDEALAKLENFLDDATKTALNASKAVKAAVERIEKIINTVVDTVDDAIKRVQKFVGDVVARVNEEVAAAVDWLERNLPGPLAWIADDLIPFGWSLIKLNAALIFLAAALPTLVAEALICNLVTRHYGHEIGTVAQAILRGDERYSEMHRIERLPADRNYVITSDIHRWVSTDEMDMPTLNRTRLLYAAVLEYYGRPGDWVLIENGDVEDYWLRGGTAYGVVYDMANHLPGPDLDRIFEGRLKIDVAKAHLAKIIENNKLTYARIKDWFDDKGNYVRTNGNHDDVNLRPELIQALEHYMPHIRVAEYVVLTEGPRAVALITHGHQADAWNQKACSYLGRATTSLSSALRDLSFGEIRKGVPDEEAAQSLLAGTAANRLDQVGPFGVNFSDLGSLDEQVLFEAFHRIWGTGRDIGPPPRGIEPGGTGPWLILGHTHVPLSAPSSLVTGGVWWRYLNTGCSIFPDMITCVEWSRHNVEHSEPYPRLVAWTWNEPPRSLRRYVMIRTNEGTLAPEVEPMIWPLTLPLTT
jgi:hypothetical protein